jgi:hypothetical protein
MSIQRASSEHQVSTINKEKKEKNKDTSSSDELFAAFWRNYPRKIGKGAALKAWKKITTPSDVIEKMKEVLPRQIESNQWTKDNGQYIPHPATYLNQRRWEDETIE